MEIIIREIDASTLRYVNRSDNAYVVNSRLVINAEDGKISYRVVEEPPHTKRFQPDEIDYSTYISNPEKTVFFAFVEGIWPGRSGCSSGGMGMPILAALLSMINIAGRELGGC